MQVITLDHEKYERELNNIAQGHSKSVQARDNMKLRAMGTADAAKCDLSARLPKVYEALGEETGALTTTWILGTPILTCKGIYAKTLPVHIALIYQPLSVYVLHWTSSHHACAHNHVTGQCSF